MFHELGHRLIVDLVARTPDQNIFISPVSIGTALAICAAGAAGATRAGILAALGAPDTSQEQLDQHFADLAKRLDSLDVDFVNFAKERSLLISFGWIPDPNDPQVAQVARVDMANGIWLRQQSPFVQTFVDHVSQAYQAEARRIDFGAAGAAEIINTWVRERTNGMIDQIAGDLNALTAMILVNAVYFKGQWSQPFEARRTVEAPFTLTNGSQIICDLMYQSSEMGYFECDTFQLALLPIAGAVLGRGDGAHLAVALPQPGTTCLEVLTSLGANWQASMAKRGGYIKHQKVVLWLPRFRIAYATSLNDTLKALGAHLAFSPQADFSGLTPIPTTIDDVQHKATIVVNERGAEAAAATRISEASFGTVKTTDMRVDRPFICGIVLNGDLTPVFLGVINNPERTDPA
jgi:serpin B